MMSDRFVFHRSLQPQQFTSQQQAEFASAVQASDASLEILPVLSPRQLQLLPNGLTADGFRFDAVGFAQVAAAISPGLAQAMRDLADPPARRGVLSRTAHGDYARRCWNDIVRLRLDDLRAQGWQLVLQTNARLICGLITGTYHCFGGSALYVHAETAMTQQPYQFYAAQLRGLSTQLWYRSSSPEVVRASAVENWSLRRGWYFASGEVGRTAARASLALFTPYGICLGPYRQYGRRVWHARRAFEGRWQTALRKLLSQDWQLPWESLGTRLSRPLGFAEYTSAGSRRKYRAKWLRAIQRDGLPRDLASGVLSQTLQFGAAHRLPAVPSEYVVWGSRTLYDLFRVLLTVASRLPVAKREAAEQVAFEILVGSLPLPGGT